ESRRARELRARRTGKPRGRRLRHRHSMKIPKQSTKPKIEKTWAHEPGIENRVATAAAVIFASGRAKTLDEAARSATQLFKTCDLLLSEERDFWQVRQSAFLAEFARVKRK